MPTETSNTRQYRKKTKVEDPASGEHVVIVTTVKYSGDRTNRVKEVEAQIDRAHTLIDEMDQTSLPLGDKETVS